MSKKPSGQPPEDHAFLLQIPEGLTKKDAARILEDTVKEALKHDNPLFKVKGGWVVAIRKILHLTEQDPYSGKVILDVMKKVTDACGYESPDDIINELFLLRDAYKSKLKGFSEV